MLLQEIINTGAPCLTSGDSLEKAVRIFKEHKINIIPVTNPEGKLLSVFTRTSLCNALLDGAGLQKEIDPFVVDKAYSLPSDLPDDIVTDIVRKIPVSTTAVTDESGKVVGLFTTADMVVNLLKKEEMLNVQLKSILNSIHNGVVSMDENGIITMVNPGIQRIFGLNQEECLGLPIAQVLPGLDLGSTLQHGDTNIGFKYVYGGTATVVNTNPLRVNGEIKGAIAIFQDLTDLELIAKELETVKDLNQTLNTVFNIFYDGLITVDSSGLVVLVNRALVDFLGQPKEEIVGKHITKVLEESKLHVVARTGIPDISDVQNIQGKPLIVSRLPVIKDEKVVGAVGRVIFPNLPEVQELARKVNFLQSKIDYYKQELDRAKTTENIIKDFVAESAVMKRIKQEVMTIGRGNSTILITGESGTGKEVIARLVHMCSERSSGPLIKVNCAAIPENLLEAEMFGYEAGAFTGAAKNGKVGRFELANGGTLFLDEIGDMPLSLQAKFLRVCQDRELERVGGTKSIKLDIRIVSATNKDLQKAIAEGAFREDLYYRLNVINLHLPSLRERQEDIEPLIRLFIAKYSEMLKVNIDRIDSEAMNSLKEYSWPGNIRELENVIERAVNYSRSGWIQLANLPAYLVNSCRDNNNQLKPSTSDYRQKLDQVEKDLVISALKSANGNKAKAAKILNLSRSRLYVKLNKFGLLD